MLTAVVRNPNALILLQEASLNFPSVAPSLHRSRLAPSIGPWAGVHRQNGHSASSSQTSNYPEQCQSRQVRDGPLRWQIRLRNQIRTRRLHSRVADHHAPACPIQDPGLNNGQVHTHPPARSSPYRFAACCNSKSRSGSAFRLKGQSWHCFKMLARIRLGSIPCVCCPLLICWVLVSNAIGLRLLHWMHEMI
ncbi:hypothetical protein BO78DRAFT_188068 [Aspergillus sclerotiicarbonarius CBS 121057]|uniref:Uncharacterized protein n=1 Tax=Aspergillus sclerotiicarbonarius (strain CBS 121057 / IBT 28362) TaxID=1448318 RepID=A0A319E6W0_ASPSB|nr:hypothetical protein BO78DRAFT_188068 [Aspergillus sclerotiicarbonarius CBS 121057]